MIMIMVIPICAIFVMIIKSMLNPIKGSGEFIQLTRLESETNQSKNIFSTFIAAIITTNNIIIAVNITKRNIAVATKNQIRCHHP